METTEQFWTQTRWGLQGEDGAVRWRVKEQEQEPGVRRTKEKETAGKSVKEQEQELGVRRVREQEQDSGVRRVKEPVKAERRARARCKEDKRCQLGGFASLSVDSLEVETVRKTLVDSLEMETGMRTEDDTERNTEINRRAHSLMDRQTGQSLFSQGQSRDSQIRLESMITLP